jgi:glycosyltransferase involved in cell wall biosynthesis
VRGVTTLTSAVHRDRWPDDGCRANVVVYLAGGWSTFHRRPMLESLARQGRGRISVICVDPFPSLVRHGRARARVRRVQENLHIASVPVVVPGAGVHRLLAHARTRFLGAAIRRVVAGVGHRGAPTVAWLYKPEHAWMLGLAGETLRVYECYDEYTRDAVSGEPRPDVLVREQALLGRVDLVFTTSARLFRSRRRRHDRVHYAPNGVPFAAFSSPAPEAIAPLDGTWRPLLMCVGGITEENVDPALLRDVASRRPDWCFALVGPRSGRASPRLDAACGLGNVRHVPAVPHERLPALMRQADVLLVPYTLHEYAHARNPLKIWEYLAVGTPVVATALEEVVRLAAVVRVAGSHDAFIAQIDAALREDATAREARRRLGQRWAAQHDWDRLTARMLRILASTSRRRSASAAVSGLP